MRLASDQFFGTIPNAHNIALRARICAPNQIGVNPVGTVIDVESGSVTYDSTADINATCSLTARLDSFPLAASDLGSPYGQELFIERGIVYGNGKAEYVGLGYFRINSAKRDEPRGLISLTGADRMANIADAFMLQSQVFGSSASVQGVVDQLVQQVMPGVTTVYDFSAGTTLLGIQHVCDDDRLKFLLDLVNSFSKTMYFDYTGRLQIKSRPDPTKTPVYTINSGRNGVLAEISQNISRDSVYNAVIATGEPAGELPPVRGVAIDNDPASPTYFYGPFGQVPRKFNSTFMTTQAQCDAAALSMLSGLTGLPYTVSLGTVPNPALETGDVIRVTYDDYETPETHIIEKLTIPLSPKGLMQIETRKQYLKEI